MIRRTSSSTRRIVCSDTCGRPKASTDRSSKTVTGPIASDIPHRPTMFLAIVVAWTMSFSAPVETTP